MNKYRLVEKEDCYGNKLYKAQVKGLLNWNYIHKEWGTEYQAKEYIEDHKRKTTVTIKYINL